MCVASTALYASSNISPKSLFPPFSSITQERPPKGDVDGKWQHDQFGTNNTLLDRMQTTTPTGPRGAIPKTNFTRADRALREATGTSSSSLSIRGASTRNVVEISGLVPGTSPEDVQAIFKQCGTITNATTMPGRRDDVTVRLTFKIEKDALEAVKKFNGQVADGRELKVSIVGGVNTSLSGRLGAGVIDGDSVDALMSGSSGSKMRSDEILMDAEERARAHVLTRPPGTDPRDYEPSRVGGGRGRPGGRGGRGRGRGRGGPRGRRGGDRMDMD
ncbi:hypothetical protein PENSPDRAFT_646726 [Peniophora sp. CONT]|nr:hypothetical protein PENSPDRAFT_646726 [Peniophora sp. CONT]